MKTVTIHDAKTNLSKYIASAKNGHKVYIGGFGKPEVVLTKISSSENTINKKRSFSIAKGKIIEKTDSFTLSTDRMIAEQMYTD